MYDQALYIVKTVWVMEFYKLQLGISLISLESNLLYKGI